MKNILFFILFIPFLSNSQTEGKGLWTTLSVDKKIIKNLNLSLNGQVRLTDDISRMTSYFGEAGLSYDISKNFTASVYYRYINKKDWKPKKMIYENIPYHRFYGEVEYSKKIGKLKISDRIRYQQQFKDTDTGLTSPKDYLRNKLEISINVRKNLTPYISADLFYRIGDTFDQIRAKGGLEYKINKHNVLDISIFNNLPLNGDEKVNSLIIGFGYKFKFGSILFSVGN